MLDLPLRERYLANQRHKQLMASLKHEDKPIDFTGLKFPLDALEKKSGSQLGVSAILLSVLRSIAGYLPKMLSYLPSKNDIKQIRLAIDNLELPDNSVQLKTLNETLKGIREELKSINKKI